MRIGVVGDTHMPRFGRRLPEALRHGLIEARVELIVHLGDFTAPEVASLFEEIAPLEAVAGNNDPQELVDRFGTRKVIEAGGVRLGLLHGHPIRPREPARTLDRALNAFPGQPLQAILFGHSHIPHCAAHGGVWLVNPGSPTDRRSSPVYSWALLTVEDDRIEPEIRTYSDRSPK